MKYEKPELHIIELDYARGNFCSTGIGVQPAGNDCTNGTNAKGAGAACLSGGVPSNNKCVIGNVP